MKSNLPSGRHGWLRPTIAVGQIKQRRGTAEVEVTPEIAELIENGNQRVT